MHKIFLFILLLTNMTTFAQKKAVDKPMTHKDSMEMMELVKKMQEAFLEDYKPSDKEIPDKKAAFAVPADLKETSVPVMNNAFINSFYFKPSPFGKDELLVEFDNFFYPNPRIVTYDTKWIKATDKTGKNYLDAGNPNNVHTGNTLYYTGNQTVKLKSESAAGIARLEGEITIKVPVQFKKVTFNQNDINIIKKIDTFSIWLLKMENNLASVFVDKSYDLLSMDAFNKNGMPLETSSNTSIAIQGDDKQLSDLHLPKGIGQGSLMYIKVQGTIASIEVVMIAKTSVQKLKLNPSLDIQLEKGQGNITKERYTAYTPVDYSTITKVDTALFNIKDHLKLTSHTDELDKTTKWNLFYYLPSDKLQSPYAQASFSKLSFYNKGKISSNKTDAGYYDQNECSLSANTEDDNFKPIVFDEIRGEIHLLYPQSVKTIKILKGEKKSGIDAIQGNKVSIDQNAAGELKEYLSSETDRVLRAYGKGPWPLKKDSYSSFESNGEKSLNHQYYWGNVNYVELDVPGNFFERSYPFTLKKEEPKPQPKKKGKK